MLPLQALIAFYIGGVLEVGIATASALNSHQ
jgi:hypothetical protein